MSDHPSECPDEVPSMICLKCGSMLTKVSKEETRVKSSDRMYPTFIGRDHHGAPIYEDDSWTVTIRYEIYSCESCGISPICLKCGGTAIGDEYKPTRCARCVYGECITCHETLRNRESKECSTCRSDHQAQCDKCGKITSLHGRSRICDYCSFGRCLTCDQPLRQRAINPKRGEGCCRRCGEEMDKMETDGKCDICGRWNYRPTFRPRIRLCKCRYCYIIGKKIRSDAPCIAYHEDKSDARKELMRTRLRLLPFKEVCEVQYRLTGEHRCRSGAKKIDLIINKILNLISLQSYLHQPFSDSDRKLIESIVGLHP